MKESNRVEEFRVGNYVISAKSGSLGKVVSTYGGLGENGVVIEIGDILTGGYTSFVKDEDIRPIPLTEGLLEDVLSDVFQKAECDYKYRPTEYEIPREVFPGVFGTANWSLVEDDEERGKWWLSAGTGSLLTVVKSLHHIQNLFYDLEGKELSIRERRLKNFIKTKSNEKE